MDVVLPPHLHHHRALGARSQVPGYHKEPVSDLPFRPWEGNHCAALPGDTRMVRAPARAAERLCDEVNGQMSASLHPSLQVHLKVATAFRSLGGGPLPSCCLDKRSTLFGYPGGHGKTHGSPAWRRLDDTQEGGLLRRPHVKERDPPTHRGA